MKYLRMNFKKSGIPNVFCTVFILIYFLPNAIIGQNSNYIYEQGTLWVQGFYDILKDSDESVYDSNTYNTTRPALMWDRTANNGNGAWTEPICWIYTLTYKDRVSAEVRIRQRDYTRSEADALLLKYSDYLGRLPYVLRNGIKLINIMKAEANFGGNNWNNSIDIYEGTLSERLLRDGNMEEMLLHEGTHSALDYLYDQGWKTERDKDTKFVSRYAYENPNREDISETFAVWLALRNKENRLNSDDYNKVVAGLSNRFAFLNSLDFDLNPIQAKSLSTEDHSSDRVKLYPNPVVDFIKLDSPNSNAKAYIIYNILGKIVLEGIINNEKTINFKKFPKGTYFIKLDNRKEIKFIKK